MTLTKQRALVTVLVGLGLLIVGFFGLRTLHAFREFRGHRPPRPPFDNRPAEIDVELIRDWMTIPFIGKMYHVPPAVIFEALNIPNDKNREKSLKELNDEYFADQPGYVLTTVKSIVQANIPPSTAAPPTTAILPATMVPPSAP